jgi:hypothetical protein
MKTQQAIAHAGSARELATLLGITPSAISQWGEEVPESRCWQIKVLKPEWFTRPEDDCKERRTRPDCSQSKAGD